MAPGLVDEPAKSVLSLGERTDVLSQRSTIGSMAGAMKNSPTQFASGSRARWFPSPAYVGPPSVGWRRHVPPARRGCVAAGGGPREKLGHRSYAAADAAS